MTDSNEVKSPAETMIPIRLTQGLFQISLEDLFRARFYNKSEIEIEPLDTCEEGQSHDITVIDFAQVWDEVMILIVQGLQGHCIDLT